MKRFSVLKRDKKIKPGTASRTGFHFPTSF